MRCEFSEKIFEIFWDHEILNKLDIGIYVPSQSKEKKLGYDALLQGKKISPIAIQFKVPESLVYNPFGNASNAFKFELHKNKGGDFLQHKVLVKRSRRMKAFYVVPKYNDFKTLYSNHKGNTIIDNSLAIEPIAFLTEEKNHHIIYDTTPYAEQHSTSETVLNVTSLNIQVLNDYFQSQNNIEYEEFTKLIYDEDTNSEDTNSKDTNSKDTNKSFERKTFYFYKVY